MVWLWPVMMTTQMMMLFVYTVCNGRMDGSVMLERRCHGG